MKKVAIVDFGLGNLFSVKQACDHVGIQAEITTSPDDILSADAAILPGVGAFAEAMNNLVSGGLDVALKAFVSSGKPLMGICLGLQLLFEGSEEFGEIKGLGLIKGKVKRIPGEAFDLRVPQIGWNPILKAEQKWEDSPLKDIEEESFMYFVHSYYVAPESPDVVLCETDYNGFRFCSGVKTNKNIFAVQFHPEKSASTGLRIYKNWATQHDLI